MTTATLGAMPARRLGVVLFTAGLIGSIALLASSESSASRTVASQDSEAGIYDGTSVPNQIVDLPFAAIGKVSAVHVREGDLVEEGDLLMEQDSRVDRAELQRLTLSADVAARVALAEQRRDLAEVQLKRLEEKERIAGTAAAVEIEEAQLNKAIAETQIGEERRQGLVAEAQVQGQQALVDDRTLKSPTSGVIRAIAASVGEVFGPQSQEPAVTLVSLDPLEVEFRYVPAPVVSSLSPGDSVEVRHVDEMGVAVSDWLEATVVFIDPVVDASTQNRFFKVEVPNPELRAAGQRLHVRLASERTVRQ